MNYSWARKHESAILQSNSSFPWHFTSFNDRVLNSAKETAPASTIARITVKICSLKNNNQN